MKFIYLLSTLIFLFFVFSCEKDKESLDVTDPVDSIPIDDIIDTLTGLGHEESGDYTWDESSEIIITLNGGSITAGSENVRVDGSIAIITRSGNYKLTGILDNGSIIVESEDDGVVRLILDNASVHNSIGPGILIEESEKVVIKLADNSQNQITDGASYSQPDADLNAALFSKSDMTIFGNGTLIVNGNYKDGITGKDGFIIKSGTYQVNAVDDGIRGKDYLIVQSADISVTSGGDGLKSDEETNPKPGNIVLEGSKINAITGGDGISAEGSIAIEKGFYSIVSGGGNEADTSSLSQKGLKAGNALFLSPDSIRIDAVDHAIDSDGSAEIRSGKYTLSSARAGIHSNTETVVSNGEILIERSMEGFESHKIIINGGSLNITSIDDCFSATAGYDVEFNDNSLIQISGGYLVLDCLLGDGIDSNGGIEIVDGTIIIHGPGEEPEVAVDFNANFNIKGGFFIASGTNSELMELPDTTSTQYSILAILAEKYPAETIFHITDDMGTNVVTFIPTDQYQSILYSSPDLVKDKTYRIYVEGSVDGSNRDGLSDGSYTPGLLLTEFVLTEKVTMIDDLKSETGH